MKQIPQFFLGANSREGFISYFSQLQEKNPTLQLLILKGGPGSGKSSLMKRVLKYALSHGNDLELIPCASDPESVDALIDYTAGFAIMDGTAPHTLDPLLPGARQHIMYTGDLWDCKKLSREADKIEKLTELIGDCHKGACSYIRAASALFSENIRISKKSIDTNKAALLLNDIIAQIKEESKGKEKKRLLSAVTPDRIKNFDSTPLTYADKIYVISDSYGGFADYMLSEIYARARLKNARIILCPCSLNPQKTDHLIFPGSRLAILKENELMKFSGSERISADEFYSFIPMVAQLKKRQEYGASLLKEGCLQISDAKLLHDELESFYVSAMDFSKSERLFSEITSRFYK